MTGMRTGILYIPSSPDVLIMMAGEGLRITANCIGSFKPLFRSAALTSDSEGGNGGAKLRAMEEQSFGQERKFLKQRGCPSQKSGNTCISDGKSL